MNPIHTTGYPPQTHQDALEKDRNENDSQALLEKRHNRSQFILNECALKFPRLSEILKAANQPWTIASLKAEISKLEAEHCKQLAKWVQHSNAKEEALLGSLRDEIKAGDDPEGITKSYEIDFRNMRQEADDFFNDLQRMQLEALEPLYRKLQELEGMGQSVSRKDDEE